MVTLYLDSLDYSNFTNEKLLEREPLLKEVLAYLRSAVASGRIKIVYSAAHVSEMLPLNSQSVQLAKRKFKLMRELCGSNALLSIADLGKIEVSCLSAGARPPDSMLDPHGRWSPHLHFSMRDCTSRAHQKLAEQGASRALRRKAMPELVRLYREENAKQVAALIASGEWPCLPTVKQHFLDAAREKISWPQLTAAFYESLNDFDCLASSIDTAPNFAKRVRDIVRGPGEKNGVAVRAMLERINLALESEDEMRVMWRKAEEGTLQQIVAAHLSEHGIASDRQFSRAEIKDCCPGIYSMVVADWRFLAHAYFGGNKKGLTDSSYVDTIHALYAPYVDVFRADSEMAQHVRAAVDAERTSVVGKLSRLVEEIENRLAS